MLTRLTHNNGHAVNKLSTRSWPTYYSEMPPRRWRREIAFRGDLLNVPGAHIVVIETNDRTRLTGRRVVDLQILHASGGTVVSAAAARHWNPSECIRRVLQSPMAQWGAAWNSWGNATAVVEYGRIHLWR